MAFEDETPTTSETNLTNLPTHLYVYLKEKAYNLSGTVNENLMTEIPFTKYKIKESDMRVKTMSFTSPVKLDLTIGVYLVKIVSILHENFVGEILSDEFTENSDGTYTYQCQDMSRQYQTKFEGIINSATIYQVVRSLLTRGGVQMSPTQKELNEYKLQLSGLRPVELYQPSLYGNIISTNLFEQKPQLIIRNTSFIQAIRDICNSMGYVDVYFDSMGTLQIEPISLKDWQNTGLYLTANQTSNRKFKFDVTNAITIAHIHATDKTKIGTNYYSKDIMGLDLTAFFGKLMDVADNPVQSTDETSTTTTTTKTTTTTNTNSNPYNNRAKKILVSADGGSGDFRSSIINLLKNDGWTVTDLGTGPGTHSTSYNKLSNSYSVNLTIYNGCDPETIKEPVTGWLKGKHEKYGVALVQMFDTRTWTNPKGMKPYRYGDFTGYTCHKAWDDNYSGKSDAQAKIDDLGAWYKKYRNQVLHCAGPSPSEAYAQFKAGGYLKYKGL